jgi:hypothetical protein
MNQQLNTKQVVREKADFPEFLRLYVALATLFDLQAVVVGCRTVALSTQAQGVASAVRLLARLGLQCAAAETALCCVYSAGDHCLTLGLACSPGAKGAKHYG